jgi:hypothetical protein
MTTFGKSSSQSPRSTNVRRFILHQFTRAIPILASITASNAMISCIQFKFIYGTFEYERLRWIGIYAEFTANNSNIQLHKIIS